MVEPRNFSILYNRQEFPLRHEHVSSALWSQATWLDDNNKQEHIFQLDEFFQVTKRTDSATVIRTLFLNFEEIVKKFKREAFASPIHQYIELITLICTLMGALFVYEQFC